MQLQDPLPETSKPFCRVAEVYVVVAEREPGGVVCEVPPLSTLQRLKATIGLVVGLEISLNGVDYQDIELEYTYLDLQETTLNLFTISPYEGPTTGNTLITVSYPVSPVPSTPICRFGSIKIPGSSPTDTSFLCLSPAGTEAIVPVTISFNGVDFSGSSFLYSYEIFASFVSLQPSQGQSEGGTKVLVLGKGFRRYPGLGCVLGGKQGLLTYRNQFQLECVSPPALPGLYPLRITLNSLDYYQAGLYQYRPAESIVSLTPSTGPKSGGTLITVSLTYYFGGNTGVCRFGSAYLTDVIKEGNSLVCRSPPYAQLNQSPVSLTVSSNGVDFQPGLPFTYYEEISITTLQPARITDDAVDRTFTLTVLSSADVTAARVTQGNASVVVPVTKPDGATVLLVLPWDKSLLPGRAAVAVTGNLVDFSLEYPITVFTAPRIVSLTPAFTFPEGGSVIQVTGLNFPPYSAFCRFGSTTAPARVLTSNLVECLSPPGQGSVPLSVSLNDLVDFSNELLFEYWEKPTVTLNPVRGRNREHVEITLETTGDQTLKSVRFLKATVSLSSWHFPSYQFPVPSHPTGVSTVLLTWNYVDVLDAGVFTFSGECEQGAYCGIEGNAVLMSCPAGSFCPYSDTTLPYRCLPGSFTDTPNSVLCGVCPQASFCPYFGLVFPFPCPFGSICPVTSLSFLSSLTRCPAGFACSGSVQSPCKAGSWCGPASSDPLVTVYRDYRTPQLCGTGSECTSGLSTSQTGSNPCPLGYYCEAGGKRQCPAGTYCPVVGLDQPLSCRPGYYMPYEGEVKCIPCESGYIAPGSGNSSQDICPAGYVCATLARPSPFAVCPAGSYCLEGRRVLIPDQPYGPVLCKAGTYCLMGTAFDKVKDGDVSHPQTCIMGTYCEKGSDSPAAKPCPTGNYCPSGSSVPTPVGPGYFADATGSGIEQACGPGTFSNVTGAISCLTCPGGYYCETEATTVPVLCPAGTYRGADPALVYCQLCPEGTWSGTPGLETLLQCTACKPSIVCSGQGMTSLSEADPCPEGYVCGPMTTAFTVLTTQCPGGYWCGIGTANISDYGVCEAGYYCPLGTASSTRYQHPCNPGYYCPYGTNATVDLDGNFIYIERVDIEEVLLAKELANNITCADVIAKNYTSDQEREAAMQGCRLYPIPTFPPCTEDLSLPSFLVNQYTRLKCPDGTTSPQGSQCVGQCVSIGDTITVGHYNPYTAGRRLSEYQTIELLPLSIAILTFSFQALDANFKYGLQYSIYLSANYTEHVSMPSYFSSGLLDSDKQCNLAVLNFHQGVQVLDVSIALHNALFLPFANQFARTMDMTILSPSRANYGTNDLFVIILWGSTFNSLSMPFNLIQLAKNDGEARDPLLLDTGTTDSWSGTQDSLTPFDSSFWEIYEASTLAITWLPFFQNCEEFGDYIHLFSLLENSHFCELHDPDNITVASSIPTSGFTTVADSCLVSLQCYYAEDVQAEDDYWFNIKTEQTLFRITQDPHPVEHVFPSSADSFDSIFTEQVVGLSDNIIPVKFVPIIGASGVPTNVTLTIRYYQMDERRKNLVSVTVTLDGYNETASTRPSYILTIDYQALNWFDLLNTFQFAIPTYIFLFVMLAVGLIGLLLAVYWLHRLAFRIIEGPKVHFRMYWKTTAIPPTLGTVIGAIPVIISALIIQFIRDNNPLIQISGNWSEPEIPDQETSAVYQRGRVALCLLYTGTYLVYMGVGLLVPLPEAPESEDGSESSLPESTVADEKPLEGKRSRSLDSDNTAFSSQSERAQAESPEQFYNSQVFKRRFFLITSFFLSLFTTFKLELSYTVIMGQNLYSFLLMFFLLDIVIYQLFARLVLEEALLVAPFFAALTLNEIMVTMAADNFTSFILAYVFVIGMILFMRMYFNPVMQKVEDKCMLLAIQLIAKYHWAEVLLKRIVMRQLKMHNSLASALSRDSGTNMEGLLDTMTYYSAQVQALLMAPFVFLLIYMFGDETQMPQMYGIRKSDVVFYLLFSAVLLLPQLVIDIYAFHLLETLYDYKFFDYFTYCSYRFKVRTSRWLQGAETKFDRSLLLPWRSLDHMCYSSQYYFAVTLASWGIVFFSLAWTIMMRNAYNPFNDPIGILLIVVEAVIGAVLTYGLKRVAGFVRLWKPRAPLVFTQNPPEENDPGEVVNLIEAYMEENALRVKIKTNLFKGKFLKKNKAWIFSNLNSICHDNAETLHMLKGKYRELVDMETADLKEQKKAEERETQLTALPYNRGERARDDISEDLGDMEEMCALLSDRCKPLVGNWLNAARLNLALHDMVKHPERMRPDCEVCGNSEDLLYVPEHDFHSLVREFRQSLRSLPIIPWRWRDFYESRQVMHTFCLECSYLHTLQKRNDQGLTQPLTRMAAEALRPRFVPPTAAAPATMKLVLKWLLEARARMLHARPRTSITTLPDITGSGVSVSSLSYAISEVPGRHSIDSKLNPA